MMYKVQKYFVAGVVALFLAACSDSSSKKPMEEVSNDPPAPEIGNIVEVASEAGTFSTLITALEAAGLDSTLADTSASYTVFAPTDDAFAALGQGTIDALLADTDKLTSILTYHVLAGDPVASEAAIGLAGSTVETVNGDKVAITVRSDELYINNAKVTSADIEASNGIIHVIDAVITPPEKIVVDGTIADAAIATESLSTLVTAVQAAGLVDALSDPEATFTVFAPTNEAFAALGEETITALLGDIEKLTDILQYHVVAGSAIDSITALSQIGAMVEMLNGDSVSVSVEGGVLKINNAAVTISDIVTNNGIVHVIDTVLMPTGNIVEVAIANGSFTTLVQAVQAANLVETLADETKMFTVFAPTDEAFAALPEGTLDSLLADVDALSNVLLYHVIADQTVDSDAAVALAGSMVTMANGQDVTITVTDGKLFLNDSEVIIADVKASNGIIHVLDAVLIPE